MPTCITVHLRHKVNQAYAAITHHSELDRSLIVAVIMKYTVLQIPNWNMRFWRQKIGPSYKWAISAIGSTYHFMDYTKSINLQPTKLKAQIGVSLNTWRNSCEALNGLWSLVCFILHPHKTLVSNWPSSNVISSLLYFWFSAGVPHCRAPGSQSG